MVTSKEKMKLAIETYLNVVPYATGVQLTYFLENSTLGFPAGITTAKVGAVCKDCSKIGFKLKGNVKYYYLL